jgi:hypothetical protein
MQQTHQGCKRSWIVSTPHRLPESFGDRLQIFPHWLVERHKRRIHSRANSNLLHVHAWAGVVKGAALRQRDDLYACMRDACALNMPQGGQRCGHTLSSAVPRARRDYRTPCANHNYSTPAGSVAGSSAAEQKRGDTTSQLIRSAASPPRRQHNAQKCARCSIGASEASLCRSGNFPAKQCHRMAPKFPS